MDRENFEKVYDEHAGPLYGFLAYRTGNPSMAEDLVADTFERAWVARSRFNLRKGSEKTWLYSIALNRLRDEVRRSGVEERAVEAAGRDLQSRNGHSGIEQAEVRQLLMSSLAILEEPERDALALRYGGDLSLKEIAQVLGVPRSTVEGRVYRGLKKLWQHLAEEVEPADGGPPEPTALRGAPQ